MVLLKAWFDVKGRFYTSLLVFVGIAFLHVLFFPLVQNLGAGYQDDLQILKDERALQILSDYQFYITERWFKEIEINVIFAILLSLGGILVEAKTKTILLTLSLPVRRSVWLLSQFAMILILLAAMNVAVLPLLLGAAPYFHSSFNPFNAVLGVILLVFAAAPYTGITILFTSITNDSLRAGIYSFAFLIFSNQLDRFSFSNPWMPEMVTEIVSGSTIPWQSLITIIVVSTLSLVYAIKRFRETDF